MPEAYIAAAAAILILGILIGLVYAQIRYLEPLQRVANDGIREATRLNDRLRFYEALLNLHSRAVASSGPDRPRLELVTPGPGWRYVDGELQYSAEWLNDEQPDPKGWYAAKKWERQQERAAHGEEH